MFSVIMKMISLIIKMLSLIHEICYHYFMKDALIKL